MTETDLFEEPSCVLCGSQKRLTRFDRPYDRRGGLAAAAFAATTDEFTGYGRIVRCADCGHVYTCPRPQAEALLRGYGECSDEAYLAESSSRSINAHLSLNTIKACASGGRLLEVGSSVGYFLNAARVDFDVTGLEPSGWARKIAAERFKLECWPEPIEQAVRFADGSFDVVAMIDVIEHLADPKAAVAAAARVLRRGGILYLVTPDIESLSAQLLGPYWWGLRPAHIQYFSEQTLRALLERAGFEITLSKSFGRIFSYGYWASRLKHYPAWLRGALGGVIGGLGIERKLLYLDTRDSIEICARKR